MTGLDIGIGLGLQCIGLAGFHVIVSLRGPRERGGTTEPRSLFLATPRPGSSECRHMRSSHP